MPRENIRRISRSGVEASRGAICSSHRELCSGCESNSSGSESGAEFGGRSCSGKTKGRVVNLETPEPKSSANVAAKKRESYLSLNSDPAGAKIMVDGLPTGHATPTHTHGRSRAAQSTVAQGRDTAGRKHSPMRVPGQTVNFAPQLQPAEAFGREKSAARGVAHL